LYKRATLSFPHFWHMIMIGFVKPNSQQHNTLRFIMLNVVTFGENYRFLAKLILTYVIIMRAYWRFQIRWFDYRFRSQLDELTNWISRFSLWQNADGGQHWWYVNQARPILVYIDVKPKMGWGQQALLWKLSSTLLLSTGRRRRRLHPPYVPVPLRVNSVWTVVPAAFIKR